MARQTSSTQQTDQEKEKALLKLGATKEGNDWILWKVVDDFTGVYSSPTHHLKLSYTVGKRTTDPRLADLDPRASCASGINVHATCAPSRKIRDHHVILELRVRPQDVACVPNRACSWRGTLDFTGGPKLRVTSCFVVASYDYPNQPRIRQKQLDLIKMARGYELIPATPIIKKGKSRVRV